MIAGRLFAVLLVVAVACGDAGEPPPTTTTAPPPSSPAATTTATTTPGGTTTSAPAAQPPGTDLRFVDFGSLPFSAEVTATVEPGDVSVLVWARAPGAADEIAVIAVTDPAGELRYELDFDSFEVFGDLYPHPIADLHEVALLLPGEGPLDAGEWVIELETLGNEIVAAGAIVRSGAVDGPQALDLRITDATAAGVPVGEFVAAVRDVGEVLLGPVGIEVGAIDVTEPEVDLGAFAELAAGESDEEQRELCAYLSATLPPARAVDVVVVDRFVDPSDDEGVVEGNAAGLPGVVLTSDAVTSCVIVVADEEDGRGLLDRVGVVWHEAGHLLGLPHTSEADGSAFDFLGDTPECPLDFDEDEDGFVDEFECPDGGNFMFHDTDNLGISDGQAAFLRRHPLLYPAS